MRKKQTAVYKKGLTDLSSRRVEPILRANPDIVRREAKTPIILDGNVTTERTFVVVRTVHQN